MSTYGKLTFKERLYFAFTYDAEQRSAQNSQKGIKNQQEQEQK